MLLLVTLELPRSRNRVQLFFYSKKTLNTTHTHTHTQIDNLNSKTTDYKRFSQLRNKTAKLQVFCHNFFRFWCWLVFFSLSATCKKNPHILRDTLNC